MIDFQKDVLEQSHGIPVLVDFWAPWCGPCRVLGPVLEQLAREQKDRWALVKVNTEEQPELAEEFNVMSIPNVKLFHKGKVIDEFVGALPKASVERWLDKVLPRQEESSLQSILDMETTIPDDAIALQLQQLVKANPGHQEAKLALARHLVFKDQDTAKALVEDIHVAEPLHDKAEDVRNLAELFSFDVSSNGSPAASRLSEAKDALQNKDPETAIQKIIEAVALDKHYGDDLPRRSAIALFHIWGNEHPLTLKYRRRFDMVLY